MDVAGDVVAGARRPSLAVRPGRHGPGHNIFSYHRDPDGNTIEVFCEIDVVLDERELRWEPRPWHEEFPMGPKHWPQVPESANHWGPMDMSQLEH